jgi:hypothetical protein
VFSRSIEINSSIIYLEEEKRQQNANSSTAINLILVDLPFICGSQMSDRTLSKLNKNVR